MADPTTTNLTLAVPTHGSDVDTWDQPVNGDFNILDACAGSVTTKSITGISSINLTVTEAQVAILRFTGTLTASVGVNLPAIIKSWVCENFATGAFVIQIVRGGDYVALPPGSSQVYWDGTNVRFINLGQVGGYWDYAGAVVPLWVTTSAVPPYLVCDGSTYNTATYPLLFQILGTNTLPDFRGRFRASLNAGTGRITTANSGIDGNTRFSGGGSELINGTGLLTQANLPNVTLSVTGNLTNGNVTINNQNQFGTQSLTGPGISAFVPGGGSLNFTGALVSTALTGNTSSINGGVGQSALTSMPPICIGGITMIRAA